MAGLITAGVDGLEIESLIGVGNEFSLEGCSVQGGLGNGSPFFVADGRKIFPNGEFLSQHFVNLFSKWSPLN